MTEGTWMILAGGLVVTVVLGIVVALIAIDVEHRDAARHRRRRRRASSRDNK